ncbi:hypothetical protein C7H62_1892 [Mesoflavibacter sp. HG96]|uniref:glutaredoxin family protein n=1 Tax=Mesoflavibacter TaxID=444051 RepID=UPI000D0E97C0|nr:MULTISPECIES: glutaredoxin domain-containing protein [Mesoflavibacter]QIJ89701.1 hypothetical protein C7H62_1892 [Mesoflavibacter sp. HG96]QIJ92429.1 hypothetical protein C7H56_1892 [Mesoflavibacter sp. HG37]
MKNYLLLLLLTLFTIGANAQNDHKYVKLIEEIKGKRYELYIENTDSISYDIFLKVDTEDFRRSSERPILKTIPPKSKQRVLTMVILNGKEGKYTYTLIINEVAYALQFDKDFELLDTKLDEELKSKTVEIYTQNDCSICPDAKRILTKNKIGYKEYNIDQDTTHYNKLIKEFKALKPNSAVNHIPILKVDNKVYNQIESLEDFIEALRDGFN